MLRFPRALPESTHPADADVVSDAIGPVSTIAEDVDAHDVAYGGLDVDLTTRRTKPYSVFVVDDHRFTATSSVVAFPSGFSDPVPLDVVDRWTAVPGMELRITTEGWTLYVCGMVQLAIRNVPSYTGYPETFPVGFAIEVDGEVQEDSIVPDCRLGDALDAADFYWMSPVEHVAVETVVSLPPGAHVIRMVYYAAVPKDGSLWSGGWPTGPNGEIRRRILQAVELKG